MVEHLLDTISKANECEPFNGVVRRSITCIADVCVAENALRWRARG